MNTPAYITLLQDYHRAIPEPDQWIGKNQFIFDQAKVHGLALAGSIAIAVASKKFRKLPSDIDLVCASFAEAQSFINSLERKLTEYNSHWRVYVNHRNEFVPPGALTHFRFQSAMWMPICIMVVPVEKFRFWLCAGGLRVQLFDFVKEAATGLTAVDSKPRLGPDELDMLLNDESNIHANEQEGGPLVRWEISSHLVPQSHLAPPSTEPTYRNV